MGAFRYVSAVLLAAVCLTTAAADLGTLKNTQGGVTISATPLNVSADAAAWEFKIVLDTHSQDLSDDLMKTAVLLGDAGRSHHLPVAWVGAAPGGHHREGVLKFQPIAPAPAALELQIRRAGEATPRSFRWQLR